MAKIDTNLFAIKALAVTPSQSEELLKNWVAEYSWETIKAELAILSAKRSSQDNILRILAAPTRLEFLTALAIKSKFPHVRVIPNYTADDTGLPTSTAGGGVSDIECIEQPNCILVEVIMAEGGTQTKMEIWPIERHLIAFKQKYTENTQSIFVAPSIYHDTQRQIEFVSFTSNGKNIIRPYKINDFVTFLENTERLYAM